MATTPTIEDAADISKQGSAIGQPKKENSGAGSLPWFFYIGNRRIEIRVVRNGNGFFIAGQPFNVKPGDRVDFLGNNLEIYSSIEFSNQNNGSPLVKNFLNDHDKTLASFKMPDLNELVANGGLFWVKLLSNIPGADWAIQQSFNYSTEKEDQENKEEKKQQASENEAEKPKGTASSKALINNPISGPVEAFTEGAGLNASRTTSTGKNSTASTTQIVNKNLQSQDSGIDDLDVEAGVESTSSESISAAGSVSGQSELTTERKISSQNTISGVAQANGGGTKVSGSSQVETSASANVSGVSQINAYVSESTGGSVKVEANVQSANRGDSSGSPSLSGQEAISSNISGAGDVGQKGSASLKAEGSLDAKISGQSSAGSQGAASVQAKAGGLPSRSSESGRQGAPAAASAMTLGDVGQPEAQKGESGPDVPSSGEELSAEAKNQDAAPSGTEKPVDSQMQQQSAQNLQEEGSAGAGSKNNPGAVNQQKNKIASPGQTLPGSQNKDAAKPAVPKGAEGIIKNLKDKEAALGSKINLPTRGLSGRGSANKGSIDGVSANTALGKSDINQKADSENSLSGAGENPEENNIEDSSQAGPQNSGLPSGENHQGNPINNSPLQQAPAQEEKKDKESLNSDPKEEPSPQQGNLPIQQPSPIPTGLNAATEEAVKLVNTFINDFLIDAALWVWTFAVPTFGVTVLLGAIVGDFLFLAKDALISFAIKRIKMPLLKGDLLQNELENIKGKIKFNTAVKVNVFLMNLVLLVVIFIILLIVIVTIKGLCDNWISGVSINLSGYGNICKVIDGFTSASQNTVAAPYTPLQ